MLICKYVYIYCIYTCALCLYVLAIVKLLGGSLCIYLYLLHLICMLLYQRPWSPDGTFCTYIAGHSAAIFIWHSSEGPERP